MILVLTKKASNRVSYIFDLLLKELLGIRVKITQNPEEYSSYDGPRFSYGVKASEGELFFAATELLYETGISLKTINYFDFEGSQAFFAVYDKSSELPFDLFAASFFLVSRYEEYLPHIRDEYGRFLASGSEAFKNGFLRKPVVNIWALKLGEIIRHRFPSLIIATYKYSFCPTIDIDAAYAYKHKGVTRTIGGFVKSLQQKNYAEIRQRIRVILNREQDPFDTFDYLFQLQLRYKLKPLYFILMADYGPKDKNIPVNNRQFLRLIKLLSDYAEVGIHPSYASAGDSGRLGMEIARLSKVLHQDVTKSRQHFLRIEFPITYRNLINQDIKDDYTMGYPEEPGFRASICTSFNFYDLDQDMETHLRIHPFAIMDGTLHDYLRLTPVQSIEVIAAVINEIKAVNGTFIPLWHNQTVNDWNEWKGWSKIFEKMIQLAVN